MMLIMFLSETFFPLHLIWSAKMFDNLVALCFKVPIHTCPYFESFSVSLLPPHKYLKFTHKHPKPLFYLIFHRLVLKVE